MNTSFFKPVIIYIFLFLALLTSCHPKSEYRTYIGPKQLNLLSNPKAGSTVVFDENGTRTTTTVSSTTFYSHLTQENKGGMYTGGGSKYYNQSATVYYEVESSHSLIVYIYANSEDPYRTEGSAYTQSIEIGPSHYAIDFDNKLSSITINGVTYTDVVLGIDTYRNDTLYWKKDIGILGWKRADQSFTAYRVF